ncbi:hypothetical protein [Helicobacter cetorum]|uniref:hypothetical protein n=1 Tax=Helicobacter cetorum TaxID=138563 RepID=UPI000CF0DD50|nr:hypothetical protein [Helicobacter cetorum]
MLELPNPRLETHFYSELLNRVSTALNEKVEWKEQVYLSLEGIFNILTSLEILLKEPKENLESAEKELLKALERKLGEYNAFFRNLNIELERETNALKEKIKLEQESIKALELALKQSETKSLKALEDKKESYLNALKEQLNTSKAHLVERTNVLKQELETLLNALKQDLLENKENALLELNERLNAILSALNTEKQSAFNALKENATTELNNNKQSALNAIENKETSALENINALKELSLNSLNALKENVKNALNLLKENATTELNALKESFLSESRSLLESKQLEINASLESVRNSVNESLENREFLNTKLFYFEREINFANNTNTFKKIRTLASLENQQTLLSPNKHYLIECFFKYEFKNTNNGEIVLVFGNDENFDIPAKSLQTLKGLSGNDNTYGVYLVKFFYTPRMEIKEIALYAKGIVSLWVNVNYLPTDGFWQKFKDFNILYHNNTLNKRIEDSCTFSAQTLYLQITELSHYVPSISMT